MLLLPEVKTKLKIFLCQERLSGAGVAWAVYEHKADKAYRQS